MGLIRDFFAGYSHGSNKAGQERIEGKLDDLSSKVDSMNSSNSSNSSNSKNNSRRNFIISKDADEHAIYEGTDEYNKLMNR